MISGSREKDKKRDPKTDREGFFHLLSIFWSVFISHRTAVFYFSVPFYFIRPYFIYRIIFPYFHGCVSVFPARTLSCSDRSFFIRVISTRESLVISPSVVRIGSMRSTPSSVLSRCVSDSVSSILIKSIIMIPL